MAEQELEKLLRGKALRIYLLLLSRRQGMTAREVQRELGLSTPSLAVYHLERLREAGLLSKDEHGRYAVAEKADVHVLRAFVVYRNIALPRFLFYAVFFTSATVLLPLFSIFAPLTEILGTIAALSFWYETWRFWRRKPF
ncbi:MAG: hypothetical protein C4339_04415 [Nitrososphaerota archaeon]